MFDLTLTFDNGPTEATPAVLDLLAEHGVTSTFFVLGQQLADPALRAHAERAHAEGHWIGNHTYSHTRALGQFDDLDASVRELADTQALIGELAHPDWLFRPYANGAHLDRRVLNRRVVANAELYQRVALERQQSFAILANIADGIVAVDREGAVVLWNAVTRA